MTQSPIVRRTTNSYTTHFLMIRKIHLVIENDSKIILETIDNDLNHSKIIWNSSAMVKDLCSTIWHASKSIRGDSRLALYYDVSSTDN